MKKTKYQHDTITHNTRAAEIVVPRILEIIQPKSLLDVGCGLGTWSYVFKKHNVTVHGIDWDGVDRSLLMLDPSEFTPVDLENGFIMGKKYDLIICLEVAEHLDQKSSDVFVKSLVDHADVIVFSAAIPNQGGDNHVNEQSFEYWIEKFNKYGYSFYDCFREQFWQTEGVEWWYKQNMFLVSNKEFAFKKVITPNLYIHPALFEKKLRVIERFYSGNHSILTGFKFFVKTILNKFK